MAAAAATIPTDWARFQAGPLAGTTLMRAQFRRHAFERHSHETFSVCLTQRGVQAFRCGGALHTSLPGDIVLFNPDEAHDGRAGTPEGYGYAILYVPDQVMADCSDPAAGLRLPAHFASPVVRDPELAPRLATLLQDEATTKGESLRAEELTRALLQDLLLRHGEGGTRHDEATDPGHARLARVRDWLHDHHAEDVRVQDLARIAGLSRAHLSAAFAQRFGMPPHAYLNTVRMREAQRRLLAREPMAEVALACGFADQSHFNRRFKGTLGLSPGAWLRQVQAA